LMMLRRDRALGRVVSFKVFQRGYRLRAAQPPHRVVAAPERGPDRQMRPGRKPGYRDCTTAGRNRQPPNNELTSGIAPD